MACAVCPAFALAMWPAHDCFHLPIVLQVLSDVGVREGLKQAIAAAQPLMDALLPFRGLQGDGAGADGPAAGVAVDNESDPAYSVSVELGGGRMRVGGCMCVAACRGGWSAGRGTCHARRAASCASHAISTLIGLPLHTCRAYQHM